MKNLQKIIAVVLVCLTINAMGIFGGCGKSEVTSTPPEEPAHVHHYISKDIPSTCTEKGYTEYTCECGDSYHENEKELLPHTGRYQCSMCKMDFGEEFKKIIQEHGTNGEFTNNTSDYTQKTYSNDTFECVMVLTSSVVDSVYSLYLAYSSFDEKWIWLLDWGTKAATGEFSALSSASISVPVTSSSFKGSVTDMVKDMISVMVYNTNVRLKTLNAGFTMENLGLKF